MNKITRVLFCAFLVPGLSWAQEKFSANFELGLGVPFVGLDQSSYLGYKPNLMVNAGIGYQFDAASRLRADAMAGQLNGNDAASFFQTQLYEGSLSYEYNLVHLFDPKTDFKVNVRAGAGACLTNSNRYDIVTRQRVAEVPNPGSGGETFSLNTFLMGGINAGIPITNKIDLNVGYAHRLLLFQPWLDAFDPNSFDTYGVISAGLTYFLKSDRDKSKIEVDPKKYEALKMKADSATMVENQLNRNSERVARLEMSNQEKDMQIASLRNMVDSLKSNPVVVTKEVEKESSTSGSTKSSKPSTDLGEARYRVVVVSSPTRRGAERFIERTKLDDSEMEIAYIEKLDTYRVIYKSSFDYAEAKKYRSEARQYYADAWISKF